MKKMRKRNGLDKNDWNSLIGALQIICWFHIVIIATILFWKWESVKVQQRNSVPCAKCHVSNQTNHSKEIDQFLIYRYIAISPLIGKIYLIPEMGRHIILCLELNAIPDVFFKAIVKDLRKTAGAKGVNVQKVILLIWLLVENSFVIVLRMPFNMENAVFQWVRKMFMGIIWKNYTHVFY